MSSQSHSTVRCPPKKKSRELVGDRYRIDKCIGRGVEADVFHAFDMETNRPVAVKRLIFQSDQSDHDESISRFEHEYYRLSHLTHPGIIKVYDYGVDQRGPYYTMELLDGAELYSLCPLDWKKVCAVLADICCSLSYIHSLRFIHRDIMPRNIRCDEHGHAKLIDFGAMVPFGPCNYIASTPSFTAPEMANYQSLDARADLFSLGITAYYLLTGRHAYPARAFRQLRDVWRSRPEPPSKYVEGIPPALDSLVMSLFALNPMARPSNAVQVLQALSQIMDLSIDSNNVYAQTCINKPTMVGREDSLIRVRRLMIRALKGKGSVLTIKGKSGVGLSRFLDASVFEGKIVGAVVIRSDAVDARQGDYGVVRALISQLLSVSPDVARASLEPYLPDLRYAFPELVRDAKVSMPSNSSGVDLATVSQKLSIPQDKSSPYGTEIKTVSCPHSILSAKKREVALDNPFLFRSQLQTALSDWFLSFSARQFLLIAVDDYHAIDEPSAAFLAVLASDLRKRKIIIASTVDTDADITSQSAFRFLEEAGSRIKLRPITSNDTTRLLFSVSGEVEGLAPFANRLHNLAEGKPRLCVNLLQYLIERQLVRFENGSWQIPKEPFLEDLTHSYHHSLSVRLSALSADALELASALALGIADMLRLSDYVFLTEHQNPERLYSAIDQLVSAQVLTTNGKSYTFTQKDWVEVLKDQLDDSTKKRIHLRLANQLGRRNRHESLVAHHLFCAEEHRQALDILINFSERTLKEHPYYSQGLTEAIYYREELADILQFHLSNSDSSVEPIRHQFALHKMLLFLSSHVDSIDYTFHATKLFSQLARDAGLDIWHQQVAACSSKPHPRQILSLAKKRYLDTPERDRVYSPFEALRELLRYLVDAAVFGVDTLNLTFLESLPKLDPYHALLPVFGLVDKVIQASIEFVKGRFEQSYQCFREIQERISAPDGAGLTHTTHRYVRLSILDAMTSLDVLMGLPSALNRIDELDKDTLFLVRAWQNRMQFYYHQGNARQAENCRNQAELYQIQFSTKKYHPGLVLWSELLCCSLAEDPVGVKQNIDYLETFAERYPGWKPILYTAQGEYDRICGDYQGAQDKLQMALNEITPTSHLVWSFAVAAQVKCLALDGRLQEARELGIRQLNHAIQQGLDSMAHPIEVALSVAEARLGDVRYGIERCERVIHEYEARKLAGVYLGYVYEIRSYLAIQENQMESYIFYAEQCGRQYRISENVNFHARFERLSDEARRSGMSISTCLFSDSEVDITGTQTGVLEESFTSDRLFSDCHGPQERAQFCLSTLIKESKAEGGFLYTMQPQGPILMASLGDQMVPTGLDEVVQNTVAAELSIDDGDSSLSDEQSDSQLNRSIWTANIGDNYFILTLGHQKRDGFVITGVALLRMGKKKRLDIPWDTASDLSQALLEQGDVIRVYAA